MKYISTRGQVEPIAFKDAVMMGMASDGGLLIPESFPNVADQIASWKDLSFQEIAFKIFSLYIDDIPADALKNLVEKSYSTFDHELVTPVTKLSKLGILELFHGPTLAFKDVALQFLGNLFEYILNERNGQLNILGATSGDTGSAAIQGVRGKDNINIFIMHPDGKTSPLQALQMTSVLEKNVFNIAVEGSFDDCQGIMKETFADLDFKNKFNLGAVNSVNWARILAQTVYYFHAYNQVAENGEKVSFAVPTGNFGDIFAGYIAKSMGLPIDKLVLAANENDILSRFFNSGVYERGDVNFTISPAMDIQIASNFERYLYFLVNKNPEKIREAMEQFKSTGKVVIEDEFMNNNDCFMASSSNTEKTLATIKKYWNEENYLLDPHTAVGVDVAESLNLSSKIVCLSTAHPAKFPDAIQEATGEDLAKHPTLEALKGAETRCHKAAGDLKEIQSYLAENALS
ncbi:MAG: threonine synthase [Lentisphaerales bacterium]|nr:threonine synthase [Lentisphaerales bacterium]